MLLIDQTLDYVDAAVSGGMAAMRSILFDTPEDGQPRFMDERATKRNRFSSLLKFNEDVVVNGVDLSQQVVEQLRRHGINPGWCNEYELKAAEQGAKFDCKVFDEPDGDDFFDALELTDDEKKKTSFCEKEQTRRKAKYAHANDNSGPDAEM